MYLFLTGSASGAYLKVSLYLATSKGFRCCILILLLTVPSDMNIVSPIIRKIALSLVGLTWLSLIFCACCRNNYIRIAGLESIVGSDSRYGYWPTDTLALPGFVIMNFNVVQAGIAIPSLYGFKCPPTLRNDINMASVQLSIDRAIIIGKDTIPSDTNLLQHRLTRDYLSKRRESQWDYDHSLAIEFTPTILTDWLWEEGWTILSLACRTEDGIDMAGSVSLFWAK
jgi:hypothetical protein